MTYHDGFTVVDHSKKKPASSPGHCVPAAASANANFDRQGKVWQSPFEWLTQYGIKEIKGCWTRAMAGTGICLICHHDKLPRHVPTQCPMLAELNLRLIICPPVGGAPSLAPGPSPSPAPAPTPKGQAAVADSSSVSGSLGSSSAPSGMTAVVTPAVPPTGDFDYDNKFHWDGDEFGAEYIPPSTGAPYLPLCSHIRAVLSISTSAISFPPHSKPPHLLSALPHLLNKLSLSPINVPLLHGRLAVPDTGATNHMVPNKSCFISYKSVSGLSVWMGNNSYVPVLGRGTAIFALNGKRILVRNVLHVPGLAVPLYSLHTHVTQHGCGFLRTNESGFLVYFPTFILLVDMAVDCPILQLLGHSAPLHTLNYVQPRFPLVTYPSEVSPSLSTATPSPAFLALTEADDNDDDDLHPQAAASSDQAPYSLAAVTPAPNLTLDTLSSHLKSLTKAVHGLTFSPTPPPTSSSLPPSAMDTVAPMSIPTDDLTDKPTSPILSTMTSNKIARLLHHPSTYFPSVQPCDTANSSNTKTHWSTEELHCIMGCCKFQNYKHHLQVSHGGEWVNGGKFPASLGSYATIPKSKRGGLLDCTTYHYVDAMHMDIAFGDCIAVGGHRYALVLVDHATRYNWTFGLKTLSSADIISALCLFCVAAGSLARCFYHNCDLKLFGTAVSEYLIHNDLKVVAAPTKCQSANGLVESHWKVMVHMAHVYITEKQMPCAFWFCTITHAARMMNAIPGKHFGWLASPFLLVCGVGHDERTWIPLFSLAFFHHEKDGDIQRSKHQAHTMDGIVISRCPTSNALLIYNPCNKQYYEPDSYCMDPYHLPCSAYPSIKYDGGLFVSLLCDDNPHFEEKYPPGTRVKCIDTVTNMLLSGTVIDIPFPIKALAFPRTARISCNPSCSTMVPVHQFHCHRHQK